MKDKQIQSLFIIAWHLICFIGGVVGLIGNAVIAAIICFSVGLILPVWMLFNNMDEEIKNAKV